MGQLKIFNGLLIHREKPDGGAVFRCHVGYGGPVWHRQILHSRAEVFHKFFHHIMLSEEFGNHQHKIGGRNAFFQFACQADAYDLGNRHIIRLSQHHGFCFYAADPPSHHSDTVNHGRVRIGADQSIRKGPSNAVQIPSHHNLPDIFKVHLMAYSGVRRHDPEIVETLLSPLQERISFLVSLVLFGNIFFQGIHRTVIINLNGVVDNQIYRNQRIDFHGIFTKIFYCIPHGGQIHHCRHTGEILHQNPGRMKRNFHRLVILSFPASNILHVFFLNRSPVQFSQQVFNQDSNGKWEPLNISDAFFLQQRDVRDVVLPAVNINLFYKFFWVHDLISLQRLLLHGFSNFYQNKVTPKGLQVCLNFLLEAV